MEAASMSIKTYKLKIPNPPKVKVMANRFPTTVNQETRRLTGVTPKLLQAYSNSPARFLKRSSSLRVSAGAHKASPGGQI